MPTSSKTPNYRHFDVIMTFFVAVLIISNIASSAKIVDMGFTLFHFQGLSPIRLVFDGGTLLFPIAYVLGDVLTEVYGFRAARRAIWTGFIALSLSSVFFFILSNLPGDVMWEEFTGSSAFNAILGGMSAGGIVIASLSGFLIGSFSNSILHSVLKVFVNGRFLWVRTIFSSLIGEFLDTIVFIFVASLARVFMWELFSSLVLTNYLIKVSLEALLFPITFFFVKKLKKDEGIDVYDTGVKFNPFTRS